MTSWILETDKARIPVVNQNEGGTTRRLAAAKLSVSQPGTSQYNTTAI